MFASSIAIALVGCAEEGDAPSFEPHDITIWNRCSEGEGDNANFYELREVRTHRKQSYQEAPNQLSEPLAVGAKSTIRIESGEYITVIRRRNLGELIALTTSEGIEVDHDCGLLEVFDEAFRLGELDDAECFRGGDDGALAGGDAPAGDSAPGDSGVGDPEPGD